MFDYQAGEKYKLTLIMVAVAGLLAGMFFTMLLMPAPESPRSRHARMASGSARASMDPDVVGYHPGAGAAPSAQGPAAAQASAPAVDPATFVDRGTAKAFMEQWLPRVWDLNASSAEQSQMQAIQCMTPECAAQYQGKVWTADMATMVKTSTLRSGFQIASCDVSENLQDGSVVVKVTGLQTLMSSAGTKQRQVAYEYMVKKQPDGQLKVAGISDTTAPAGQ